MSHSIRLGVQGIHTLRQLDVSQCLGLTDAMGERLYLSRSAMEALDISYTAVSSDVVGFLAAVRPACLMLRLPSNNKILRCTVTVGFPHLATGIPVVSNSAQRTWSADAPVAKYVSAVVDGLEFWAGEDKSSRGCAVENSLEM